MGKGYLKIDLRVGDNVLPVKDVKILLKDKRGNIIYELITEENGSTDKIALDAPDIKNSSTYYGNAPDFAVYDVEVPSAHGYKKIFVHNVKIFDSLTTILPIIMQPAIIGGSLEENAENIYIPLEHGVDIPKDTSEMQNTNVARTMDAMTNIYTVENVMANEVRIPEYIIVHLGAPNATASNVRVPFKDYIKNVASSEIFPTWPESALYANIYAQISFTLNRIFTVMCR